MCQTKKKRKEVEEEQEERRQGSTAELRVESNFLSSVSVVPYLSIWEIIQLHFDSLSLSDIGWLLLPLLSLLLFVSTE